MHQLSIFGLVSRPSQSKERIGRSDVRCDLSLGLLQDETDESDEDEDTDSSDDEL